MQHFTDYIDNQALSDLEALKHTATELEVIYDEVTARLEKAAVKMGDCYIVKQHNEEVPGYDYDSFSSHFKNINHALIEEHRGASLIHRAAERKHLSAKDKLLEEVGNKIALEYKDKALELGDLHYLLYGLIHANSGMNSAVQFRQILVPSGTHYGNLQNTTDQPFGRSAILYEQKTITEGNEMAKQVRAFRREH